MFIGTKSRTDKLNYDVIDDIVIGANEIQCQESRIRVHNIPTENAY